MTATAPELFSMRVTLPEAPTPSRWFLLLHGILGQGGNLRTLARRWLGHHPDTGALLVDLRNHGKSQALLPPDDLDACASDLERLTASLGLSPVAVLGHSFGGKVALHYAARAKRRGQALEQLWVLDSTLATRSPVQQKDADTEHVIATLEALPTSFESREAFLEHLRQRGISEPTAAWLAMNVVHDEGSFRFGPDLQRIRAMLQSYFTTDLWPALVDRPARRSHIVVAERARTFTAEERAQLSALASASEGHIQAHLLAAGHWVHVDAPNELDALLANAAQL